MLTECLMSNFNFAVKLGLFSPSVCTTSQSLTQPNPQRVVILHPSPTQRNPTQPTDGPNPRPTLGLHFDSVHFRHADKANATKRCASYISQRIIRRRHQVRVIPVDVLLVQVISSEVRSESSYGKWRENSPQDFNVS